MKKALILGTSFTHIRAAMWSQVEGLSKWEANNHRELELHPLVTFLLIAQSPKEKAMEARTQVQSMEERTNKHLKTWNDAEEQQTSLVL